MRHYGMKCKSKNAQIRDHGLNRVQWRRHRNRSLNNRKPKLQCMLRERSPLKSNGFIRNTARIISFHTTCQSRILTLLIVLKCIWNNVLGAFSSFLLYPENKTNMFFEWRKSFWSLISKMSRSASTCSNVVPILSRDWGELWAWWRRNDYKFFCFLCMMIIILWVNCRAAKWDHFWWDDRNFKA